jgi:hypothetical protein
VVPHLASGGERLLGFEDIKVQTLLFLSERYGYKLSPKKIPLHETSEQARKYKRPLLWHLFAILDPDLIFPAFVLINFPKISIFL